MSLFPFTIYANSVHGGVNYNFRQIFHEHRKPNVTWYAADIIVKSDTEIEFVVFDMLGQPCGGKGEEIYRVPATVTQSLTIKSISHAAIRKANTILQEKKRQKYLFKVNALALELMEAEMTLDE